MSWVPDVRKTLGGSILFFHTLTWWAPTVILSTYFCRFLLFVDHVDNARGRRRGERTKARGGRRRERFSRRGGGDACAEAQPAVGGGSRWPRRHWFGFGGWRKTGLKKHDRL